MSYGSILRRPHVWGVVVAAFVGRLPIGMTGLAMVLLVESATGSFATAGAAAAAFALGEGAGQPLLGRLVDRRGQTAVLRATALAFPAALATLALLSDGAPAAAYIALCGVAGLALPPLMSAMRALWPTLAGPGPALDRAYALEAVLQELLGLIGPVLVAVAALAGTRAPVLAAAACGLIGTLAFAASAPSRGWRPAPREPGAGALRSPGLRTLLLGSAALGLVGGAAQVAIPAFADEQGAAWASGLVLAAIAAGSIAGGLRFHPPRERYPLLLALAAAGPAVLALAPSLPVMAVLGLLVGLVLAPGFAAGFSLVSRIAPAGAVTEAFAWTSTALVVGLATGNALSGILAEAASPRAALAAGSAVALALAAAVALRRNTLAR